MKMPRPAILWFIGIVALVVAFICVLAVEMHTNKVLFNKVDYRNPNYEQSTSSSQSSTYNKMTDEERLEEIMRELKPIVERNVAIARSFVFETQPTDFTEYCSEEFGFCFSYPKRWGTFTLSKENAFCTQKEYFDVIGHFSQSSIWAEIPSITTSLKEKCEIQGNDFVYSNPFKDKATADNVLQAGNTSEEVAVWFNIENTLFYNYDAKMLLTAPTNHPVYSRIAFNFEDMDEEQATNQNIEDFLAMARSFRLP